MISFSCVILVLGCASEEVNPAPGLAAIDTSASGHIRIQNGASRIWPSSGGWSVSEELRIGQADGDGPAVFGRVQGLMVDELERIWVLDGQALEVKVFDGESGEHVRTVGRRGAGPGEFSMPVAIQRAPDGSVWVVDLGNSRIAVFDTAGVSLDHRELPFRGLMTFWMGGFDQSGRYYVPAPAPPTPYEHAALTLVRTSVSLEPIDTLRRPVDPVARDTFVYDGVTSSIPFQGSLLWHLSPSGSVWAVLTDAYRLTELTWEGDTVRTVTREAAPVPVGIGELDELRQRWEPYLEPGSPPSWWSRMPLEKPAITGYLFFDETGNMWVERNSDITEVSEYDVFDPSGLYLGPVALPVRIERRPVSRNSILYAVTLDSFDVPFIVKLRVQPS